jgi:nitrite reductase/ring-hydroxylating ferredoxin subunit
VHQRVAKTFKLGRTCLIGDAAHINNPLGGMGMNGGIHDSVNLAARLAPVWHGKASEDELDRYDTQRPAGDARIHPEIHDPEQEKPESDGDEFGASLRAIATDPARTRDYLLRVSMIGPRRATGAGAEQPSANSAHLFTYNCDQRSAGHRARVRTGCPGSFLRYALPHEQGLFAFLSENAGSTGASTPTRAFSSWRWRTASASVGLYRHESQIKNPATTSRRRWAAVRSSWCRDEDGRVSVIHNQCAHRGAMVVATDKGNAPEFTCCYHGWTYHLDGRIKAVPLNHGYPKDFDAKNPEGGDERRCAGEELSRLRVREASAGRARRSRSRSAT